MRVEVYVESSAKELVHELNAVLEHYNNEEVEIQYQHCATRTGNGWTSYFSAMVIFK